MSKWLLPPQEWPKVTKQPLATRVHGVKGDEEARRVAEHYATSINHFLVGQTQQRVNSGLDVYKKRVHLPHLVLSYAYIHGQEYLDVYVEEGVAKRLEVVEDFWDWALIEILVPHTNIDEDVRGAVIKALRHVPGPESGQKFNGYAFDRGKTVDGEPTIYWSDGLTPFSISFAPQNDVIHTYTRGHDTTQATALLVDLRRYPKVVVVIEIYAYLQIDPIVTTVPFTYLRGTPHTTSTTVTATGVSVHDYLFNIGGAQATLRAMWPYGVGGDVYLYSTPFPRTSLYSENAPTIAYVFSLPGSLSPPGANVLVPAPAPDTGVVDNSDGPEWVAEKDLIIHTPSGLVSGVTEVALLNDNNAGDTLNYYIQTAIVVWPITHIDGPQFTFHDGQRVSFVSGAGGKGWPDWVSVFYDAPSFDFSRWTTRNLFPNFLGLGALATATIGSNPELRETMSEPYKHIGTVTIDPVHKSISFAPAE